MDFFTLKTQTVNLFITRLVKIWGETQTLIYSILLQDVDGRRDVQMDIKTVRQSSDYIYALPSKH